ncbi:MAG: SIS domain-containing protein [Candidatus Omnitrophica bacterium]|nr:SIS domain-containing protein [Candidatus Omnitrophota bacterium]
MKINTQGYFKNLKLLLDKVVVTDNKGRNIGFDKGLTWTAGLLIDKKASGNKIMLIGNGASASISSHIAVDLWKNCGVKAVAFNDHALLTCISNDCGYKHVFDRPIEVFVDSGDILLAISSSGKSENIIRATKMAGKNNCRIITLSGFKPDNPLRCFGELNFYVPFSGYGPVEIVHHAICHCIVDMITKNVKAENE